LAALVVLSIISIVTALLLARFVLGIETEKPSKFTVLWKGNRLKTDSSEEEVASN
jgi:hypothetical protein